LKINKSIASIILLLTGALLMLLFANKGRPNDEGLRDSYFTKQTELTNDFLNNMLEDGKDLLDSFIIGSDELVSKDNWEYFRYANGQITQWSSNEWSPDSDSWSTDGALLQQHLSGWYLVINDASKSLIIAHPLVRYGKGSFEAQNFILPLSKVDFELITKPTDFAIWKDDAFISFYGNTNAKTLSGFWFLLAQFLLVLAFTLSYYKWQTGTLITLGLTISLRYLSHRGLVFSGLSIFKLFDPMVFASSHWVPSLGDLVLHLVVIGMIVYTIKRLLQNIKISTPWIQTILILAMILVALFSADLIRSLVGSLVLNSNISFNVTNLSSLSIYTFTVAAAIFFILWLYYMLLIAVTNKLNLGAEGGKKRIVLITALAVLGFIIFQYLNADRSFKGLFPSVVFSLLTLLLANLTFNRGELYRHIIYLALLSLFFAEAVFQNQIKREIEYLEHYAAKLISKKDLDAEFLFQDIENSLAEEFLQPEDFQSFSEKKDFFEKRLRRLYFSGYLDRYNVLVLSFDSAGNNINSSTRFSFDDLNKLYNYQALPTLSNHFYQVKSTDIFNGYLAKFENCDLNGHYGNIFILLEPKFIQSSYEYPQLSQKKKEGKIINLENYSYAVYNQGRLMHQKGSFSYDLSIDTLQPPDQIKVGNGSKFLHFFSKQNDNSIIVLSHPDTHTIEAISTFSFSFIIFALILVLTSTCWWGLLFFREQYLKKSGDSEIYQNYRFQRLKGLSELGLEQVLLSTRIRISMVALVLVGLLISLYVTIQFIRINDTRRSEGELMYKIREVANQIQNEVDIEGKLKNPEARQLIVNEIGDVFKVEASLFNSHGYLLASSVEDLYDKGIQAPLMNPSALFKLRNDKSSQILQREKLRNIEFTAAYIPLFNDNRNVIAYLNLPYFSQRNKLNHEISSYTVTFVNLYLFLMVLAFFLAFVVSQRISKPLKIIREKMSTTGYGAKNELIEWKQNDEIGRLVQQYNKMVMQLEESAEKLTSSEREGAWKEMARQVAHEIKNPLTPMKLNIQHLQRAWSDDSGKLEDTFKRVTAVLIEQIDGLSHLASEFSNFANMPVVNFEICNLTESLINTITLFEKTDNIFFQYDAATPKIDVFADKNQLNRIFSNVFKNAIQAIPATRKGKIEVTITNADDTVTVHISDNGIGISDEIKSRIFVPNFSTKNSGMGLGLAMTKKMMEASDGSIAFKTELNKGTTFHLTWKKH
jgi:signal transduction histidine kinase